MEQQTNPVPEQNWDFPPQAPVMPTEPFYPSGKKEFIFGLLILVLSCLLCNSVFYGGFHLGYAIFSSLSLLCSAVYLLLTGKKPTLYSSCLLLLCFIITTGFARSDDGFVKFILLCLLVVGSSLSLCLTAGQNRRNPGRLSALADIFRTIFVLGVGKLPQAYRGLSFGLRRSKSKKGGAVLVGVLVAVPILAILIPLLTSADAAFDALLQLLPQWEWQEILISLIFGSALAIYLYVRAVALRHDPKAETPAAAPRKGVNTLTINTVLIAICFVYCVYLVSQLAYFVGGFSGILPEGYTMAEYARRGFFEMAWLCAINLALVCLAMGLVKDRKLPTRLLCLFIGIMTLFLVCTASAKMLLYIDSYGLTRLRVLTEVIMVWLGLVTVFIMVWLFLPKLPYMKAVFLSAMILGSMVLWADVDTVVARYNVEAYQSGKLATVDVDYLGSLGNGAVPYLAQLTNASDPDIAEEAQNQINLSYRYFDSIDDFREWNYVNSVVEKYLPLESAEVLP